LVKLNESSLSDPRVHVYNADAFIYVREKGRMYDRVILDFPDPHNEAIAKLYSVEFYAMLSRRMNAGGAVSTQSSSPFFARRTYWSIGATMDRVYQTSTSYQVAVPAFGIWGFHLASKGPGIKVPRINVPTRFLTVENFQAAQVFGKNVARPRNVKTNSVFEPLLYQLYLRDLEGDNTQVASIN
jgi:spermidine synthase